MWLRNWLVLTVRLESNHWFSRISSLAPCKAWQMGQQETNTLNFYTSIQSVHCTNICASIC